MDEVLSLAVAALAGLVCGFLNTVASSGSAVSLPILLWLGLPAVDANATNRLPVLIGAMSATFDLSRRKAIPWRLAILASLPTMFGTIIGALLAERIPNADLKLFIIAAVFVALVLILSKLKSVIKDTDKGAAHFGYREALLLVLVGIWLGFIVLDGATYILLVLILAAGMHLVEANAVKNVILLATTLVAMVIFASKGSIDWRLGAVMAAGSLFGGLAGARLAVSDEAKRWIIGLLVLVIIGEIAHLLIQSYLAMGATASES